MTVMWNVEKDPSGEPIRHKHVSLYLFGEPGFVTGEEEYTISSIGDVQTDANGRWAKDLTPNTLITSPVGTKYCALLRYRSTEIKYVFTVPESDAEVWVGAQITDPPGALPSGALDAHRQSSGAHAAQNIHTDFIEGVEGDNVQENLASVQENIDVEAAIRAGIDALLTPLTDPRLSDQRVPTDNSVTTAKLANGAVTEAKLSFSPATDAEIAAAVLAEALDRDAADTALQTSIANLQQAAANADVFLQAAIDAEEVIRAQADTELAADIVEETTARTNAIAGVNAAIAAEAQERAEIDALLTPLTDPRLTNERVPVDGSVTNAKIANGTISEAKLAFSVATQAEIDAATAALSAAIDAEEGARETADADHAAGTGVHVATAITGLTETVQDLVNAMLIPGTGLGKVYDDPGAGQLTLNVTGITSALVTDFAEAVRDRVGSTLSEGTGIELTVNDEGDSIVVSVVPGAFILAAGEASQSIEGILEVGIPGVGESRVTLNSPPMAPVGGGGINIERSAAGGATGINLVTDGVMDWGTAYLDLNTGANADLVLAYDASIGADVIRVKKGGPFLTIANTATPDSAVRLKLASFGAEGGTLRELLRFEIGDADTSVTHLIKTENPEVLGGGFALLVDGRASFNTVDPEHAVVYAVTRSDKDGYSLGRSADAHPQFLSYTQGTGTTAWRAGKPGGSNAYVLAYADGAVSSPANRGTDKLVLDPVTAVASLHMGLKVQFETGAITNGVEVRDLDGSDLLFRVRNDGFTSAPYFGNISGTGPYIATQSTALVAVSQGAAHIPWGVVGADGQTGNLTEWRNNLGAVKAKIGPDGRLTVPTIRATNELGPGDVPFIHLVGTQVPSGVAFAVDNTLLNGLYPRAPRVMEVDLRGNIKSQGYILSSGSLETGIDNPFMIGAISDLGLHDPSIVAMCNVSPSYGLWVGTQSSLAFGISDTGDLLWAAGPYPAPNAAPAWDAKLTYPGVSTLAAKASLLVTPANSTQTGASLQPSVYDAATLGLGPNPNNLEVRVPTDTEGGVGAFGRLTSALTLSGPLTLDTQAIGAVQYAARSQDAGHNTIAAAVVTLSGATSGKRGGRYSVWVKADNGALGERLAVEKNGNVVLNTIPNVSAGLTINQPAGALVKVTTSHGGTGQPYIGTFSSHALDIGTNAAIALTISAAGIVTVPTSNINFDTIGTGPIIKSPNGQKWRIAVDNTGALDTVPV